VSGDQIDSVELRTKSLEILASQLVQREAKKADVSFA
jgi:hypothetical protein